jgi:hypothetical protein
MNQLDGKDKILRDLKGDEAWIIMDWAMKFIPKKGIESQTEWYTIFDSGPIHNE